MMWQFGVAQAMAADQEFMRRVAAVIGTSGAPSKR